jgi:hypothetical protein
LGRHAKVLDISVPDELNIRVRPARRAEDPDMGWVECPRRRWAGQAGDGGGRQAHAPGGAGGDSRRYGIHRHRRQV